MNRQHKRGIGSPAGELVDELDGSLRELVARVSRPAERLEGIVSGVGDVLHVLALALERAGLPRTELIGMLDELVDQVEAIDDDRAVVPRGLATILARGLGQRGRPRFELITGGLAAEASDNDDDAGAPR